MYPSRMSLKSWKTKTSKRKDTHTMPKDNVIDLKKPERFVDDPITDVLRTGARKLLTEALEAEIECFLSQYRDLRDNQDRQRLVRNVSRGQVSD